MALEPTLSPRTSKVLPNYAYPPLIAVRMGIRSPTAVGIDAVEFGRQLGPSWVKSDGANLPDPGARSRTNHDELRCTFAGVLGDQHLEVYAHGVDLVWDGRGGESYPHYETLRDAFLSVFYAWSQTATPPAVTPATWHISYWNRVPQGTVWHRLNDLRFCRLLASAAETPFADQLVSLQQQWIFRAASGNSELCCDAWLESGHPETGTDVIWVTLTCSGSIPPGGDDGNEWLSELDAGRRWIVSGFRGLMSPSANTYWGLVD